MLILIEHIYLYSLCCLLTKFQRAISFLELKHMTDISHMSKHPLFRKHRKPLTLISVYVATIGNLLVSFDSLEGDFLDCGMAFESGRYEGGNPLYSSHLAI